MLSLKKSLGQHFLYDENICRKIIASIRQCSFHQLLEVGPGSGALTKYLLELDNLSFKAIEVDEEKVLYLKKKYPSIQDKIISGSFLDMEKPFEGKFSIAGNFPYNISSQILFKILEWKEEVECMTGMFQKEVAQRIAAPEGSKTYGVLSVLVQAFFDVAYLFEVQEGSFRPQPRVKSAVIQLKPRNERILFKDERAFFVLVKTAFNQRRKTLRNATKALFDSSILEEPIFDKRAEQISVLEFAHLTFKMNRPT
jgi:16S rRNA (adenine1518-N6/adenine1519-N6)-dimethyltransferase